MTRINRKASFTQELSSERERLIIAIEREIIQIARTDQSVSPAIQSELSEEMLKNSILLVIALGDSQYFWLCYWKDGHSGAYAYDEEDFPNLKDCDQHTNTEEVAEILGLSDSTLLYAEKVEREWIINTTYSDRAAEPVAHKLVQMYKQSKEQTEQNAGGKPMRKGSKIPGWIKDYWGIIVAAVGAVIYLVLKLFDTDIEAEPLAVLFVTIPLGIWLLWKFWSTRRAIKILTSLAIVVIIVPLVYSTFRRSRPRFEIKAFDVLPGESNTYELTDLLIDNHAALAEYGVGITFTLQIRPIYNGNQQFGRVVALISGEGGTLPAMLVWDNFSNESKTATIHLTLTELLEASDLKKNSDPPTNPFRPGDPQFQQAKLIVQIARVGGKADPWATEEITIRNAPWESRSELEWRNGEQEADVYLRNLGGTGDFTFRYHLVRLEEEIGSTAYPMSSGTTHITAWYEPTDFVRLKTGDFFTDTVSVPGNLIPGRYLLEVYPIKKQEYAKFESGATWEDLDMESPWWFARSPLRRHLFVDTTPEFALDPLAQAEWERLRNEKGIDLGIALEPAEEIVSASGTEGLRQVFQKGEIYVHDGQAYALYGPILEHYRELGGAECDNLGFPISSIQPVSSGSGTEGYMIEFEGQGSPHRSTMMYASEKGVAGIWKWIAGVYSIEEGGHSGWLGFPLADEQYFADSTIQMFEHGYIVYQTPYVGEERDWGRAPVAYPYLASRGTIFDVHADRVWQDTGVPVQSGDRVTIIQVGGGWAHHQAGEETYDANGYPYLGIRESTTLTSAFTGSLIGRIGEDDGYMFSVGRWNVSTFPVEGTLYLAMNDDIYGDNIDFITVQIMVETSD